MTMPLVRLVNSAVESGEGKIEALRDEIVKYAANDLLLYRADTPAALVAAQEKHWDDALVRLARHFEVSFQPTIGIVHQPQPERTLARLTAALRDEGLFVLTALNAITGDHRLGPPRHRPLAQAAGRRGGLGRRPRRRGFPAEPVGRSGRSRRAPDQAPRRVRRGRPRAGCAQTLTPRCHPAKAGAQVKAHWVGELGPAFAGMTRWVASV